MTLRISSQVTYVRSSDSIPAHVMAEIERAIRHMFEFRVRGLVHKGSEVVKRAGSYFIAMVKSRFSTSKRRGVKGMLFHVTVTICKPVYHRTLTGVHKIGMAFQEIRAEIGATAKLDFLPSAVQCLDAN